MAGKACRCRSLEASQSSYMVSPRDRCYCTREIDIVPTILPRPARIAAPGRHTSRRGQEVRHACRVLRSGLAPAPAPGWHDGSCSSRWATIKLVRSANSRSSACWMRTSVIVSTLLVASSSRMIRGSAIMAPREAHDLPLAERKLRRRARRLACRVLAGSDWSMSRQSRSRIAAITSSSLAPGRPMRMFSRTCP